MISLSYETYLDKVFGCWLGKCISGTIGMPYEGMKQLMELEYSPALIADMVPNDDLDLQVLWLDVLEKKGHHFTSLDLAEGFFNQCPYAMGEYAIFKKNYGRHIAPPYSGSYNNDYYLEGMGCPIRAEIWACIAPGDPALAASCAAKDGILDHAGNSVYAEQFIAAMEAQAFIENDWEKCIEVALEHIPQDAKITRLIHDTQKWCRQFKDWRETRAMILRHYGHPDCTNLFQNIGITLLSMYYGGNDFIDTTMIAVNCGFDTDCTCATAGSILGIIVGGKELMRQYDLKDQGYKLDVHVNRRSNLLFDLAEDTCKMGLEFSSLNQVVTLTNPPQYTPIPKPALPDITLEVQYDGDPVIGIGDSHTLTIIASNHSDNVVNGILRLLMPDGWLSGKAEDRITLQPNTAIEVPVTLTVPDTIHALPESNPVEAVFEVDNGNCYTHLFGLAGATVWLVYGPYWENIVTVPPLEIGESYYKHLGKVEGEGASLDRVRDYHVSAFVDSEKEYLSLDALDTRSEPMGERINLYRDKFSVSDLFGWQGPCVVYLVRKFTCPDDRTVYAQIGYTDAFKAALNGKLIAERDNSAWWTAENVHVPGVQLKKGENILVLRLVRHSDKADFSIIFSDAGTCAHHYIDLVSLNPSA